MTGSPEMLGGRVKTLHPKIHGGILADRSKPEHLADLEANGIDAIDLVVSNLYPFSSDPSVELIDIGGPTMVRAAAKNHEHVGIVTSPADYPVVLEELRSSGTLSAATRRRLARAAFAHTAAYDAAIVAWLDAGGPAPADSLEGATAADAEEAALGAVLPPTLHLTLERTEVLRYGENPHQRGSRYRTAGTTSWWDEMVQHGGNPLSYLNLFDGDAAWRLVHELAADAGQPAVAIIKHANPCGAAVAGDLVTAYERALECDVQSAFGGVVAIGGDVTAEVAEAVAAGPQADVIIASSYSPEALERLTSRRKATRILSGPAPEHAVRQLRSLGASVLVQDVDAFVSPRCRVAGRDHAPTVRRRVARPGAGLAGLRPHDLERHRRRHQRPGRRGRGRAAVPGGRGRDRRAEGGGAGQGRRRGERRLLPLPRRAARAGRRGRDGGGPAGRLGEGRRGRRGRRRGRPGHGHDRRTALPALMAAILLDGEALAARIRAAVADGIAQLSKEGVTVGLGTVLVGDDVPSERYVALKHEDCAAIGMYSVGEHLPATATQQEVIDVIDRYNADPKVSAFLVQLPLPAGLDEEQALLAVDPAKDVDGLHPVNLGRLVLGTPGQLPCTPAGILELLHAYDVPVEGRHAVIIGRGVTIGRPLAMLLVVEATRLQRGGDDAAHGRQRARHGRHRAHGGHRRGGRRATRPGDARTWSSPAPPWCRPARAGKAGSSSPTCGRTWRRWRAGSRPASAASVP